ncbi:hypothetical protein BTO20_06800 [Mycobacterium dioxanotrophicus]|jgi:hypothetical protein|uniref:Uncharacterized protein n=1 Tax=Mycobacterium dioxanotrophicus TaxID=482462 RepID=A0A1Y0BZI6_9MYCO|nr:hypothetical protein [Mycobacterium dioxanotrophicus]ART68329.1 hypothetical protein BTO20_06800 [Mycobacterium dioxanotrophicus]
MASKVVDAAIFDGDTFVANAAGRPVRLMRGGVSGIVYNGWVYPLYEEDFIGLAGDPGPRCVWCRQISWHKSHVFILAHRRGAA